MGKKEEKGKYKPADYVQDFSALASAQAYAQSVISTHIPLSTNNAYMTDYAECESAKNTVSSYKELQNTITYLYGNDISDAIDDYMSKGKKREDVASSVGVLPRKIMQFIAPKIIRAYTVRKRTPVYQISTDENNDRDKGLILIQEIKMMSQYKLAQKKAKESIALIDYSFAPKSPSLSSNGGSINHDPERVELAILDAIVKRDCYSQQIAYCGEMLVWCYDAVRSMQPLWQTAFIPYVTGRILLSELSAQSHISEYELDKSFWINAAAAFSKNEEQYKAIHQKYPNVRL